MTEKILVLGQSNPAANFATPLYTCNADTFAPLGATVSSLTICNMDTVSALCNVSIAIAGAFDGPAQYLYYQLNVDPGNTFIATLGITLAATDVVRVFSTSASVSFQLFGAELS